MFHDACRGITPHGTTTQGMCRQEFSNGPQPQGIGLIFSADPTAKGFKGVLHPPEHPAALSHVPGDVELPMLKMDLAIGGVGADPKVGKKPGREISLQQFWGDAPQGSRPPKTEGSQDVALDKLEDADRPLDIRNRPFEVPQDGLRIS
jgi:hypothetical protein